MSRELCLSLKVLITHQVRECKVASFGGLQVFFEKEFLR